MAGIPCLGRNGWGGKKVLLLGGFFFSFRGYEGASCACGKARQESPHQSEVLVCPFLSVTVPVWCAG